MENEYRNPSPKNRKQTHARLLSVKIGASRRSVGRAGYYIIMAICKKLRFEVFKRDNFTCQYCGRTPPQILEIDHIISKSQGGTDEFDNLITACFDCNRGKGKNLLTSIKKKAIIKENLRKLKLQEEQLKEFYKLKECQKKRTEKEIDEIERNFFIGTEGVFAPHGRESIKRFLSIFPKQKILEAVGIAQKILNGEHRFKYMCKILHNWRREQEGDFSHKQIWELKKYWQNQPKGTGYLDEKMIKEWLIKYSIEDIKAAMDLTKGYWRNLKEKLNGTD